MSVSVENARYFHVATTPAHLFYEERLVKTNEAREQDGEKRLKMRDFMSIGQKEWAELAGDEQLTFVDRYKQLCDKAGVTPNEPKQVVEKKSGKGKKSKKCDTEEKENEQPEEGEKKAKKAKKAEGDDDEVVSVEDQEAKDAEKAAKKEAKETEKAAKKEAAKKRKAEEDAGKDKRPLTGYFHWLHELGTIERIKAENPKLSHKEANSKANEVWQAMPQEEKTAINEKQGAILKEWKIRNPSDADIKRAKKEEEKANCTDPKPKPAYMAWLWAPVGEHQNQLEKLKSEDSDLKHKDAMTKASEVWQTLPEKDELEEDAKRLTAEWCVRNGKPAPKDKEPPKAPRDAFALFMHEFRPKFKAENAESNMKEANTAGKDAFAALSEEEKAAWDAKYASKLEEMGVDRTEHEAKRDEKATKAPKAPKCPKSAQQMFVEDEFASEFLEKNAEVDRKSKEFNTAAKEAWAALSEEVKAEWEAKHKAKCEELGVDPAAPAPVDDKPKKPTKDKARNWSQIFEDEKGSKMREANPDISDEELKKKITLKVKNVAKSEKMAFQDKAKVEKAKVEKKHAAAMAEYEEAMEKYKNKGANVTSDDRPNDEGESKAE